MFTRDFRKVRLLTASAGTALLLYALLTAGLQELCRAVEVGRDVYPFRHEDYLRLLLPSLYEDRGIPRLLLAGGSDARESFLLAEFNQALPGERAFSGGQSLGTFDDLLLSLEYTEKVHGVAALPRAMLLGISARFVGNIPRDSSPLVAAINRYSTHCAVDSTPEGSRLVAKDGWDSLASRVHFLGKQQSRYRFALAARLTFLLAERGLSGKLTQWVAAQLGPYKYHRLPQFTPAEIESWLRDPTSFWSKTHAWDPGADAELIRRQFARLLAFTRAHRIELYVVNLPEVVWNRECYQPERYETYLQLVREALGNTPFLDLRTFLDPGEFYDAGHPTLPGAVRVTERVIEFIKTERAKHAYPVLPRCAGTGDEAGLVRRRVEPLDESLLQSVP